jgi:hypothetical protein
MTADYSKYQTKASAQIFKGSSASSNSPWCERSWWMATCISGSMFVVLAAADADCVLCRCRRWLELCSASGRWVTGAKNARLGPTGSGRNPTWEQARMREDDTSRQHATYSPSLKEIVSRANGIMLRAANAWSGVLVSFSLQILRWDVMLTASADSWWSEQI